MSTKEHDITMFNSNEMVLNIQDGCHGESENYVTTLNLRYFVNVKTHGPNRPRPRCTPINRATNIKMFKMSMYNRNDANITSFREYRYQWHPAIVRCVSKHKRNEKYINPSAQNIRGTTGKIPRGINQQTQPKNKSVALKVHM
jgi:hypothetical protein